MNQRLLCLSLCLMLLFLPLTGQASVFTALGTEQAQKNEALAPVLESRVLDEANLLSASGRIEVAQQILAFQQNTGMDFVLITTSEGIGDQSSDTYVEDFYYNGGYGFDEQHSGIAYFIDLDANYHLLTAFGRMEECMTDERLEFAVNMCGDFLYDEWYTEAVMELLLTIEDYYLHDHPEGVSQPEPTPLPTGDVDEPPTVNASLISTLPSVASVILFLTSIASAVFSALTQF